MGDHFLIGDQTLVMYVIKASLFVFLAFAACQANDYDYADVLGKSFLFYEAERSGPLPDDNRIPFRKDSTLTDEVLGGYFDAGDHVKFGFPMAFSVTHLAWGGISFFDALEKAGQVDYMKAALKWGTDYFIGCHKAPTEFIGQIGDGYADHGYWGRPEDMNLNRPSYRITADRPGSDLAGETAAALAAASIFYSMTGDDAEAENCLKHARELFDFADQHRAKYTQSIPEAAGFYESWSGYQDELGWAAAWMYKATNEQGYMDKAVGFYNEFGLNNPPSEFSWDNKVAGVQILMAELTGDASYKSDVANFINVLKNTRYTGKGLIFIQEWGSLRHSSNVAHVCLQAAMIDVEADWCKTFAKNQMGYILGDTGRSFVVGWGNNPPQQPHHRAASCPDRPEQCDWDDYNYWGPNPQILTGALVGGPDGNDYYNDARSDFRSNEVACDYNAGFTGALAGIIHFGL